MGTFLNVNKHKNFDKKYSQVSQNHVHNMIILDIWPNKFYNVCNAFAERKTNSKE